MGKQFEALTQEHIDFIEAQKIFFVGTATADSKVNISPKGMDSLKVVDDKRVIWLNMTGSGNETSAHVQEQARMTIMFSAFEGSPMIMRLYGQAKVIHHNDSEWESLYSQFPSNMGARQIFDLNIEMVQISCGMSVPFFDYVEEREQLNVSTKRKGQDGVKQYWKDKNQFSLDGLPTKIVEKNLLDD